MESETTLKSTEKRFVNYASIYFKQQETTDEHVQDAKEAEMTTTNSASSTEAMQSRRTSHGESGLTAKGKKNLGAED